MFIYLFIYLFDEQFYTEERKWTPWNTLKKVRELLTTIYFSNSDILERIRNLDTNKGHDDDVISIRMVKICNDSIRKPLKLIFQSCLESNKFPSEYKKTNVVPVHKGDDKQILKNYGLISLIRINGDILELLLYERIFALFTGLTWYKIINELLHLRF